VLYYDGRPENATSNFNRLLLALLACIISANLLPLPHDKENN